MASPALSISAGLCLSSIAAAQTITWNNPAGGPWGTAANWNPMTVPSLSTHDAVLGPLAGPYTVNMNNSYSIRSATISEPMAMLSLDPGRTLTLGAATSPIDGTLLINATKSSSNTRLLLLDLAVLSGSGEVVLNANAGDPFDAYIEAPSGQTASIGPGVTVSGNGGLLGTILSQAVVRGGLETGPNVYGTLDQSAGGSFFIDGVGVRASIRSGTVIGGTFETANGGILAQRGGVTGFIQSVTNNGDMAVEPGGTLAILAPGATNHGTILVNETKSSSNTALRLAQDAELGGSGAVLLNANPTDTADAFIGLTGGATSASFGPGLEIAGLGQIALGIYFSEAIIKGGSAPGIVVEGTLDQSAGGKFSVSGAGQRASIGGGTVVGGSLETAAGGLIAQRSGQVGKISGVTNHGDVVVEPGGTLLILAPGMTNHGTILVNETKSSANTVIRLAQDAVLGGSGIVTLNSNAADAFDAFIGLDGAATSAGFGPGLTINGNGAINTGTYFSQATIGGGDGHGPLVGGTIDQSTGGKVSVNGPGMRASIGSGTIIGGTFETSGGGIVAQRTGQVGRVQDVTNNGAMALEFGSTLLILAPGMTNHGTILVNETKSSANTALRLAQDAVLGGSGIVTLNSNAADPSDAFIGLEAAATSAGFGPGLTINGNGIIHTGTYFSEATIAGGDLWGPYIIGTIDQTPGGTFSVDGAGMRATIAGGTVIGGTFETSGGGIVAARAGTASTVGGVHNTGEFVLEPGSTVNIVGAGLTNDGIVLINETGSSNNAALSFADGLTIDGSGTYIINGNPSDFFDAHITAPSASAAIGIGPDITIMGTGALHNGDVMSEGTLAPGLPVGTLSKTAGSFGMLPAARLEIEIASALSFDKFVGTTPKALAGTVEFFCIDGFSPAGDERLTFLTGSAVSGRFDHALPGGKSPTGPEHIVYTPTSATLVMCFADCEGDGDLDVFDFLCFQGSYSLQDPYADCEQDGDWDVFDFLCFQGKYATGCY